MKKFFFALLLSAAIISAFNVEAAPQASVKACGGNLNKEWVLNMVQQQGAYVTKLAPDQVKRYLAEYNSVSDQEGANHIALKDVDMVLVAQKDGSGVAIFLAFKGQCAVGEMMSVGRNVLMRIMGVDL